MKLNYAKATKWGIFEVTIAWSKEKSIFVISELKVLFVIKMRRKREWFYDGDGAYKQDLCRLLQTVYF